MKIRPGVGHIASHVWGADIRSDRSIDEVNETDGHNGCWAVCLHVAFYFLLPLSPGTNLFHLTVYKL